MTVLTLKDLSSILNINVPALTTIVNMGHIPYAYENGDVHFDINSVSSWLQRGIRLREMEREKYLRRLKKRFAERYPKALKILKEFEGQFEPIVEPKLYSLQMVPNKKHRFLYYVRYIDNKKLVASRWCTHTNIREKAEAFAVENRERILAEYYKKKNRQDMYSVLEDYYQENSPYLDGGKNRKRTLGAKSRSVIRNFIAKEFIPFLKDKKIKTFGSVTAPLLFNFQNYLLKKGNKPQTINSYLRNIKCIFNYLVQNGDVPDNVFSKVKPLKVAEEDQSTHGCYGLDVLKGVFNKKWDNIKSYMLCLVIYTVNMRNTEIEQIRLKDIRKIDGCRFIDIQQSKSKNGIRLVPLHTFVYEKIIAFCRETGKGPEDRIFLFAKNKNQSTVYREAYLDMGKVLGMTEKKLAEENITYYSGRHFWKTLMNANDLGDVEEYFMGHKVSSDVQKRYNHKDKQGREKMLEKAKAVFKILDDNLFQGG